MAREHSGGNTRPARASASAASDSGVHACNCAASRASRGEGPAARRDMEAAMAGAYDTVLAA
ncbi:hypothetical protein, partial [Achromobacter xylosoxidans]|uniref:hypothetical protein n=1 Tax=Alcaligenes xylosoxydans xylosoxydans TaxID=85698 RepID=UPI001F12DC2D